MKKIIKSTECKTGNLTHAQFEYMKGVNRQPEFNESEKAWNFHSLLKTNTDVTPWLISIGDEYFVVLQVPPASRGFHSVKFFKSSDNGAYTLDDMVDVLPFYVDMESACDEFAKNYKKM